MSSVAPLVAVTEKFRETRLNCKRLGGITRVDDFYAAVDAFLAAAYSVLYVAEHQFGLKDLPKHKQAALDPNDAAERQRFDQWFVSSPQVKAVTAHPLAKDRHVVIHRTGQAGFVHVPKPGGGTAVEHGTPFEAALWSSRRGIGLPLENDNVFFYVDDAGARHDAVPFCEAYLGLVQQFFIELERRPWA